MRNKYVVNHLLKRDGSYYFVRRVPNDLKNLYAFKRLSFSLKTKSYSSAIIVTTVISILTIPLVLFFVTNKNISNFL